MVVVVMTNAVSLVTLQPIVDRIFVSPEDPLRFPVWRTAYVLEVSKFELLLYLTGFFLAARLVYAAALYTQRYLMMTTGETVVNGLRMDLYDRLISLSMPYYAKTNTGELVANLTSDLGIVQHLSSTVTADLIRRPFEIFFLVILLFYFDVNLALYSLLVAPFVIGIVNFLGRAVRSRAGRMQTSMADLSALMQESTAGIRIIQAFNAEPRMAERFRRTADSYLRRSRRLYAYMAAATPSTELVTAVAIGGIILLGGYKVIGRTMSPGEFFAFMAILMSTYQPVKTLVNAMAEANRAAAALDRTYAILDTKPSIVALGTRPAVFSSSIEFRKIAFAYDDVDAAPVLSDIDIVVPSGTTLAVVGPSGAGKSTLLSLLSRFHDPVSGAILLDGVDIRDIDIHELRRLSGIVTQETFLFNDTIMANIAFGKPDASEEQVREAARSANILEVIEAMPERFETVVGERGARLSGGEKQRIAIARALLNDPPILILDEATSSLDSESEQKVQAAIDRLIEGRTVLVIAHRFSTVQRADRIVVIEKGRIVESGNHALLLARGGLYAKLHAIQFAG